MENNKKNNKEDKKLGKQLNSYARFSGMGFQMIVVIGLGVYAGIKLDESYPNKYSLFTIIFSMLSIAIAIYSFIKQVTNFTNKQQNSNDKRNG